MKACKVKNCNLPIFIQKRKLCRTHYKRWQHHKSYIKLSPKGKRNYMWKGGVAEYPNHYLMKKNRLIILMQNPKCEICGKPATDIHHKDRSKTNHKLSNLMAVCKRHTKRLHSKFCLRYGMSLEEIAEKLGMSRSYWSKHQDELDGLLLNNT